MFSIHRSRHPELDKFKNEEGLGIDELHYQMMQWDAFAQVCLVLVVCMRLVVCMCRTHAHKGGQARQYKGTRDPHAHTQHTHTNVYTSHTQAWDEVIDDLREADLISNKEVRCLLIFLLSRLRSVQDEDCMHRQFHTINLSKKWCKSWNHTQSCTRKCHKI